MCSKESASDIINTRNVEIYKRNIPSGNLQPYLNVRPVMTKYSKLPVVDPRKEIFAKLRECPVYSVSKNFNPGSGKAPWSGFASNINLESELRNQIYALQKCSQSVYVPNSTSDLYKNSVTYNSENNKNDILFQNEVFNDFDPNPDRSKIGFALFNNATRYQLKDM
jgi:hypothetical protein